MATESSSLTMAVQWAAILGPVASTVTGFLMAWIVYRQIRLMQEIDRSNKEQTFRLKQADLHQVLNSRYDKLWDVRRRPQPEDDPALFFVQYWNLQLDQYEAWCSGFVTDSCFRTWMRQRHTDFTRDWSFKEVTFQQGWTQYRPAVVASPGFLQLINALSTPSAEVDVELKKLKPSFLSPI